MLVPCPFQLPTEKKGKLDMVLLIPQFCPHRQRTGVQLRCRDVSDWPRGSTAVLFGSHLYRMCPYGPQTHNRRNRFAEII